MLKYLICDYFATGEGRTISILITMAYPKNEDYEEKPSDKNGWVGVLNKTHSEIAKREFIERFGDWFAIGCDEIEQDELLEKYSSLLPQAALNIINAERKPSFSFFQQLHFNYS
jgi:hypothetical protein